MHKKILILTALFIIIGLIYLGTKLEVRNPIKWKNEVSSCSIDKGKVERLNNEAKEFLDTDFRKGEYFEIPDNPKFYDLNDKVMLSVSGRRTLTTKEIIFSDYTIKNRECIIYFESNVASLRDMLARSIYYEYYENQRLSYGTSIFLVAGVQTDDRFSWVETNDDEVEQVGSIDYYAWFRKYDLKSSDELIDKVLEKIYF